MSAAVEQGWAVWFWLEQPGCRQRVWVNHGDGYSPSRRCRKVFGSRWEAEEARSERRDRKPVIVRIVYFSARSRGPKAVVDHRQAAAIDQLPTPPITVAEGAKR